MSGAGWDARFATAASAPDTRAVPWLVMRLGDFEIHLLVAGGWHPDGGTLFGVVPKALWQRRKPADGDNLVRAACVGARVRNWTL